MRPPAARELRLGTTELTQTQHTKQTKQALVRWGGALLELAHYRQGDESSALIEDAIAKLKQALEKDGTRADAEWCLGNAYTSQGFLAPTRAEALGQFDRAAACFRSCVAKEPGNETYKKALDMCDKAPEYYDEIQQQLRAQAAQGGGGGGGGMGGGMGGGPGGSGRSEVAWDVAGWVVLAGIVAGCVWASSRAAAKA